MDPFLYWRSSIPLRGNYDYWDGGEYRNGDDIEMKRSSHLCPSPCEVKCGLLRHTRWREGNRVYPSTSQKTDRTFHCPKCPFNVDLGPDGHPTRHVNAFCTF